MFFLSLIVAMTASAQTNTIPIKGKVVDEKGEPLIGVGIIVVGNPNVGITTDLEGTYVLNVPALATSLQFTYLGYSKQIVTIGSNTVIDVVMQPTDKVLDEIVVVGYGVQKRRDVTGAVVSVKPDDLKNMPSPNIVQSLQGKLPGLNITNTSSTAEGGTTMRVRASKSLGNDGGPMIILDGVQYTGFLSEINPADIESMEVLKDASSAAIYGSNAANGVILITTKKGTVGKPVISFSGTTGWSNVINTPDMMDATQFYNFKKQRASVSAFETEQYLKGVNTDWLDLTMQTGFSQDYNLSISGGTERAKYFIGGNASLNKGVAINDVFNRFSLRANVDTEITKWLRFGTSTNLLYATRPGTKADIGSAITLNPLTEPYDTNGNLVFRPNSDDANQSNPLAALNIAKEDIARSMNTTNYLQVDFPFVKGLSYKIIGGYYFRNRLIETYKSSTNTIDGMNKSGEAIVNNQYKQDWSLENIVSYTRQFGVHNVFLTGVYSSSETLTKYHDMTGVGFPGDYREYYQFENATLITGSDTYTKETSLAQMLRANYSYNGKYLFTATIRRDAYSKFGAGQKYGTFPSVALGWNMEEESFIKKLDWLDRSKLRLSYGENGNHPISAYETMATMTESYYLDNSGNPLFGLRPSGLADKTLTWETSRQFNVGLDFSMLKGRLFGSIDAYFTNTYDILLYKKIPQINGADRIRQNVGKTKSNGIELQLSSINLRTRDFSWNTDFNISYQNSKIVNVGLFDESGKALDNIGSNWIIGEPIGIIYSYEFDGIWQESDDIINSWMPDAKPGDVKIVDYNKDGKITVDDRHVIGRTEPDFRFGLMNTLNYKNISFSFFFNAALGATRYTEYMNTYFEKSNIRQREWWTPENKINTYPANRSDSNPYGLNYFGKTNNASYVRLNDISLSYRFPTSISSKMNIQNLEIFTNVKNVFTLTNYVGLDPELSSDYNTPITRTYLFGLRLSL
ncbi:MAG: SusC/RagA family TonB-linked outer membrane protein [Dysgonomonas sp.]